jgi:phage shock protein A
MASTGFFARLGNLWKGFLSIWVSDVEKNHPEIAYENAINGMVEKYSALKRATAAIIRRRDEMEQRHNAQEKELAQVTQDLNVAVETNQDDLALVLIQKKGQLEAEVTELHGEMEVAAKEADSAKSSLLQVQSEIKKLKGERDAMMAKFQSAQARLRIQEQLDGLSIDAEVKALDNVRDNIKTTVAQANLGKELSESSLDQRLAKLRAQSGDVTAKSQLEQLKAAAAAAKANAQKKTL